MDNQKKNMEMAFVAGYKVALKGIAHVDLHPVAERTARHRFNRYYKMLPNNELYDNTETQ